MREDVLGPGEPAAQHEEGPIKADGVNDASGQIGERQLLAEEREHPWAEERLELDDCGADDDDGDRDELDPQTAGNSVVCTYADRRPTIGVRVARPLTR